MKTARLLSLLIPLAAFVACSAAPDDAGHSTEPTADKQEDLQLTTCQSASCQITEVVDTPYTLTSLGCETLSPVLSYTPEYGTPVDPTYGAPADGWFVLCPDSAETEGGLSPSCSYCLGSAPSGYFWYEWFSESLRPCPSGCLKGPPIKEL